VILDSYALPSFPTRRSSDLIYVEDTRTLGEGFPRDEGAQQFSLKKNDIVRERAGSMRGALPNVPESPQRPDPFSGGRDGPAQKIDRKSTRLNSSHVEISYAV